MFQRSQSSTTPKRLPGHTILPTCSIALSI